MSRRAERRAVRLGVVALFALAALSPAWGASRAVEDSIAQRMQACTVCHGREGRATPDGYFPRIAGKPAGYLYNQLVNFREGRRHYAPMAYLVEHLSDAYLREIAAYFATLELPYAPPQALQAPAATLAAGERLVRQGDAARQLPACTRCHGERMSGAEPSLPGLVGLPRDYLLAQLGAWRSGQRRAAAPDCMATIVQRLQPEEIEALASWLAAQQPPAAGTPAVRVSAPLPLDCGSALR
ncbi:MAG TPA: c-type cytochrome [Methylibium sp.]|nr:c-type cytochrome [Methylibium sp.]